MSSKPTDGNRIDPTSNGGPSAHAHSPPYQHGPTLTRREVMRNAALAGAAVAASSGTAMADDDDDGSEDRWDTRMCWYSGTDEYDCYAERAISDAASWLLGSGEAEEKPTDVYQTYDRLRIWAQAYQNALRAESSAATLTPFVHDFAEFSTGNLYAEATVHALHEANETEDIEAASQAAYDRLVEIMAPSERNLFNDLQTDFVSTLNLFADVENSEDLDLEDLIAMHHGGGYDPEEDADAHNMRRIVNFDSRWHETTVTYTLLDGSEYELDCFEFEEYTHESVDGGSTSGHPGRVVCPHLIAHDYDHPDDYDVFDDGAASPLDLDNGDTWEDGGGVVVRRFPESDYEELPEEDKEEIDPPEDTEMFPHLVSVGWYATAIDALRQQVDDVLEEVEAYIEGIWDDLTGDDADSEDFMTPRMLSVMAADEQTFPYASADLAGLGLPMSESVVTLRFPDAEEDDEAEDDEVVGNLFAHPMPSGGLPAGEVIDPDEHASDFYFVYHTVDEDGYQASEGPIQLARPFEITGAQELEQNEDGEWVAVDVEEITWSQRETTEAPTDYDEIHALLEEIADLEREIANQQFEIVVELEGEDGGGGGGFWEGIGLDANLGGPLVGAGVMLAFVVGIAAFVKNNHPANRFR
ncbi:hypothetical protein [Natrononativus amylolyticus]|uniref:hypothetical protein n=1 Tax=Natrononativus amylolyticus TaxID=2963434 RepID=UPI0020CE4EC7|nr:hypothetical protein [Natrononativus amylolyticus]